MKKILNLDVILCFLSAIVTGVFIYFLLQLGSLPMSWRIAIIAIAVILTLLCIVFALKKLPKWGVWVRRICCILLSVSLGIASFYIYKVNTFTTNITDVKDASTTISVVVKNESSIEELADLSGLNIGMNTLADKTNSEYVKEKIDKEIANVTYTEENNYIDLANMLLNDQIDALILSNSYINAASIEDSVPGFSARLRIVQSWDRVTASKDTMMGNYDLDLIKEPFTVLISGMDDTGTPNHDSRSDVNMLVMINPQTRLIQMVSFPRDAYVENPALWNGHDKLTHLGNHGIENLVVGLEKVIGFDIDFYAKVNFTSLLEIVDALGGVEVDVPYTFIEQNSNRVLNTIYVEKGLQVLNGEEALAFARHRKSEGVGDVGRTKAQQMVLTAIIKKALTTPSKLPTLLDIAPKYMVTNMSSNQIEDFLSYQLENMGSWKMLSCTLSNGSYGSLVTASMGNMPLSCYILSRSDLYILSQKYEVIYNPQSLSEFKFNLSDLNSNIPGASIHPTGNMVFSDMDLTPYLPTVEEEEDNPTTDDILDEEDSETPSTDDSTGDTPETDDSTTDTPSTDDSTPDTPSTDTPASDGSELPASGN